MKVEFLKERYDFELQRREQLTSALTLPVGVLSGLGGLMIAMVRSFGAKHLWLTVPFFASFGVDVAAFFICLVFLALAYHGQKYKYLPLLKELQDWEDDYMALNSYEPPQETQTPPARPAPQNTNPEPRPFPPNREIREGERPPRRT